MTKKQAHTILSRWLRYNNPPIKDCVVCIFKKNNSIETFTYQFLKSLVI